MFYNCYCFPFHFCSYFFKEIINYFKCQRGNTETNVFFGKFRKGLYVIYMFFFYFIIFIKLFIYVY